MKLSDGTTKNPSQQFVFDKRSYMSENIAKMHALNKFSNLKHHKWKSEEDGIQLYTGLL